MNRDSSNRLTISSPLEAHKAETICYHICGVDVGFENPLFAVIEIEYSEADQDPSGVAAQDAEKKLTYYELDLGLNHVVRKWSEPISRTANLLLSVPGGDDGPSGVLVCGENWVSYKHQGHVEVRTALPRRLDMPVERGLLITTGTLHKQKDMFFYLIQSELGDLYKVTLELSPSDRKIVQNIVVTVFDSIAPAINLCITKTGLLFAASEFGNHNLFQFQGIGDDPNAVRSEKVPDEINEELGDDSVSAARVAPIFKASDRLANLLITDDMASLSPVTDMLIDDVAKEDSKQIYALCGRGNRSMLRVLRHGVSVSEIAVSELPGRPIAVWTVKQSLDSEFDRYIIVSFNNATLVLSIGETVEEVTDSGFLTNASTLQIVLLRDQALLQVHTNGIRHIRQDQRASEWKTPGKRAIERAAVNSSQVAVALTGGMVVYLELDSTGHLLEMGSIEVGKEICAIDLGLVPEGRLKSAFMAIGCWDDSVQVLSLDTADLLTQRSAMSVPARPESVCLVQMAKDQGVAVGSASTSASTTSPPTLYLNVGLTNGVLVRVAVDPIAGSLSDSRQRFLGPKAVKLYRVSVRGQQGLLALTTRPWLMYNYQGRYYQAPVSYDALESASSFASEVCAEGIVAIAGNTLRIITVDNLGEMFNQTTHALRYTPRKLVRVPNSSDLVIIESDHNEYNEAEKASIASQVTARHPHIQSAAEVAAQEKQGSGEMGEELDEEEGTRIACRGPIPPAEGKWASCIRIVDAASGTTKGIVELSNNEAAVSLCMCHFAQVSDETFVVVGIVKDLTLQPKRFTSCSLRVYRILDGGSLLMLHDTELEDIPQTMCEFQGKLLVGVGKCLRLMDLGKRKLLRKAENRLFPTAIVRLQVTSDRIYVGDLAESVHFVRYKRDENVLAIFADDTVPR
jgi:splicing factor 3B subunit 3